MFVLSIKWRGFTSEVSLTPFLVPRERLHHPWQCTRFRWRYQQMGVVAHQHIGMQHAAVPKQCFSQALQVTLPILVVEEAGQSVVAALDHMLRHTGDVGTRKPGHADISPQGNPLRHRHSTTPHVRNILMRPSESVSDTVSGHRFRFPFYHLVVLSVSKQMKQDLEE